MLTASRTSPTAYNVFTGTTIHNVGRTDSNVCVAYSITSAYASNGVCITTSGPPVTLSSAYTETLVSANGQVVLDANGEKAFIDFLGFSTCSGGGENVVPTALIQITNTTASMTSTFSNVPLAAASATLTIAPVSIYPLLAMVPNKKTSSNAFIRWWSAVLCLSKRFDHHRVLYRYVSSIHY